MGTGNFTDHADEKGRFSFILRKKVVHTVVAKDREGRFTPSIVKRVKPGTHDLVLQLIPMKTLRLAVLTSGEEKLKNFRVTAYNEDLECIRNTVMFHVEDLKRTAWLK